MCSDLVSEPEFRGTANCVCTETRCRRGRGVCGTRLVGRAKFDKICLGPPSQIPRGRRSRRAATPFSPGVTEGGPDSVRTRRGKGAREFSGGRPIPGTGPWLPGTRAPRRGVGQLSAPDPGDPFSEDPPSMLVRARAAPGFGPGWRGLVRYTSLGVRFVAHLRCTLARILRKYG